MTNPVYETMTKVEAHGITFRVWTDVFYFTMGPNQDVVSYLSQLPKHMFKECQLDYVIKQLAEIPGVSAIEVTNAKGNGGLYYPDWK